jgi:tetrapyrrole methylase family protein/MazG family protein
MAQGGINGSITVFNKSLESGRRLSEELKDELGRFEKVHILGSGLPTADIFADDIEVHSYEDLLADVDDCGRFDEIADRILTESRGDELLLLVSDGAVGKAEVCERIIKAASKGERSLRVLDSRGTFGVLLLAAGADMTGQFTVINASRLTEMHHPSFPPHLTAILPDLASDINANRLKAILLAAYPADHPLRLVHTGKDLEVVIKDLPLADVDNPPGFFDGTSLIIPPLEVGRSFEAFQEIIAALRAPDGCPWDREQTHLSLRTNLLEETYEALSAIDGEDVDGIREELGDLLLQVVLHAQIAAEAGEFCMGDVLAGIHHKLVHRHPHVFAKTSVSGVKGVLVNWERLKEEERASKGQLEKGQLDGVPITLPSLNQAQEIQNRAARVGFDWSEIAPVLEKVQEEISEVQSA